MLRVDDDSPRRKEPASHLAHTGYGSRDARRPPRGSGPRRSEEHTSELQSRLHLVCRLLLEKKKTNINPPTSPTCSTHSKRHPALYRSRPRTLPAASETSSPASRASERSCTELTAHCTRQRS